MPSVQSPLGKRKLPPPEKPLAPDWPWIKRQYRVGLKSTREIARESTAKGRKISHVAIEKRADKEGWSRDLKAQVKAAVAEKLARDAVNKPGSSVTSDGASDAEIIDAAARQGADVIRSHRNDINLLQRTTKAMVTELAGATEVVSDLAEVIVRGTTPADGDSPSKVESLKQRRERLMRLIGLPSRAGILKDLTQSTRHLIGLERQAFNLGDETATPDSIEARLALLEDK